MKTKIFIFPALMLAIFWFQTVYGQLELKDPIKAGETEDLAHPQAIVLSPGFWAKRGSDFTARIAPGLVVWRGFKNEWGYNHRLNRLGSYIEPGGSVTADGAVPSATLHHVAASGKGADEAHFKGYYTYVDTDDAVFQQVKTETISLEGDEGDWINKKIKYVFKTDKPNNVAILNGFDIWSRGDADQLWYLTLGIYQTSYDENKGEVEVELTADLLFDCPTAECEGREGGKNDNIRDKNNVSYELVFYLTLVSGNEGKFNYAIRNDITKEIAWEDYQDKTLGGLKKHPEHELKRKAGRKNGIEIDGGANYPLYALAFQKFSLYLKEPLHYLELDYVILPDKYDQAAGKATFDMRMFFKQWNVDGKKNMENAGQGFPRAIIPDAWEVREHAGEATLIATVALLQFASGRTVDGVVEGTYSWPGDNAKATGATPKEKAIVVN